MNQTVVQAPSLEDDLVVLLPSFLFSQDTESMLRISSSVFGQSYDSLQPEIRSRLSELEFSAKSSASFFEHINLLAEKNGSVKFAVLVEAHCSFESIAAFVQTMQHITLHNKAEGCVLLVSDHFHSPTPALDSAKNNEDQLLLENLRHNQFYIRMLDAYGWSTFAHQSRLHEIVERISSNKTEYLKLNTKSLIAWQEDVLRIEQELNKRLELGVWANTTSPPTEKWQPDSRRRERFFPGVLENSLKSMALAHQFGRLDSPKAESLMQRSGIAWFVRDPHGVEFDGEFSPPHFRNKHQLSTIESRDLWEEAPRGKRTKSPELHWELVRNAGTRNRHRANAFVFELLCDFSQMLSKGTAPWAADCIRESRGSGSLDPIRVLAIKDRIRGEAEQNYVEELFRSAFKAAFRDGTLEIDCTDYLIDQDGLTQNQPWDEHNWWLNRIEGRESVSVKVEAGSGIQRQSRLLDYDIILVEAEHSNRFVGPSIVQWLDHMFDEVESTLNNGAQITRFSRPQIFVLSRDENAGHSYMCLWLGAQAFASKSRVFGIPSLFTIANVRSRTTNPDKKRLRPNFYALDGLLPHQRNRLQSIEFRDRILGDNWDRFWVQQIPKADLHYHIGTSISLDTIRALAANSTGYLLDSVSDADRDSQVALQLIENACKIALLYTIERQQFGSARKIDPYKHLWGSARYVLCPRDKDGKVVAKDAPDFNAIDAVVNWLVPHDRPIRSYEACSVLVTAISVMECLRDDGCFAKTKFAESVFANWAMLESASDCLSNSDSQSLSATTNLVTYYLLDRIAKNWKDCYSGGSIKRIGDELRIGNQSSKATHFVSKLAFDAVERSMNTFAVFAKMFDSLMVGAKSNWLFECEQEFKKAGALPMFDPIGQLVERQIRDPHDLLKTVDQKHLISLESFVVLPERQANGPTGSLKRYLIGCDFLGAEHLQYPENLLLAACDIARQNAEDNVVYSEVRCATTGYNRGGMNVIDATDLLCKGFDIGALLFGTKEPGSRFDFSSPTSPILGLLIELFGQNERAEIQSHIQEKLLAPRRWVRSNVLLGAKRHKKGDIEEVVPLLVHYLERGPEVYGVRDFPHYSSNSHDPGRWWRPCQVAGFDLSGNESTMFANLQEAIQPLFASCAPITIHAGEAMSARSIWEAVYKLGAQRIGHGLRLRDDKKLLEHCVRNDICMELCPISNDFTNSFRPIVRFRDGTFVKRAELDTQKRDQYPMLDFLDAGLEVCINTDNRSLHRASTLSDEYLKAAELCGGLTKWDILRVCKAGFKNAFLAKDDLASLLRHVEYEIYKIVSEHSGENFFPHVERYAPK